MQKKYKSYFKVYLILWLSILLCSFLFFLIYKNERIFTIYFIITLLFAMIINAFEGHRINNYLRENNKEQYMKNRSVGDIKGVYNGFNAFEYIFSSDDSEDINITKMKSSYRKTILLVVIIFFSYPIYFIIFR